MKTKITRFAMGLALAIVLVAPLEAAVGDMDTSFGIDGLLRYPEGFAGLAGLPDGRLQLVSVSDGKLRVLRLVNGRPDPAFGTSGVLTTAAIGLPMDLSTAYTTSYVQGDGSTFLTFRYGRTSTWLMKIEPSGRPDITFGPNGMRGIAPPSNYPTDLSYIDGVAAAPSGAVYVLVKHFPDAYECADALVVHRLGANGEPDVAFGNGGAQFLQLADGCYWWGRTPMVGVSDDRLLLGERGILLDARGGNLALPVPLQASLEKRRLLRIEDTGEYLYLVSTPSAPEVPGLDLNVSRWSRDLALDHTFGNSGTGHMRISLNDVPFIPIPDLVAVTLLLPSSNTQHMYMKLTAYGHKAGEQGAREYALRAYRLQPDGSFDSRYGTGGMLSLNWVSFVQQSPDGSVVADNGSGVAVRLSGSEIESPGLIEAQFSCLAANAVAERSSVKTISISRALGSQGAVSLRFWTQSLTATPGVDYTDVEGNLSWAEGESGVKTINVTLIDDALAEPDELFQLNLERTAGEGTQLACSKGLFSIVSEETYPESSVSSIIPPAPSVTQTPPTPLPSRGGGRFDGLLCLLLCLLLLVRNGRRLALSRFPGRSSP